MIILMAFRAALRQSLRCNDDVSDESDKERSYLTAHLYVTVETVVSVNLNTHRVVYKNEHFHLFASHYPFNGFTYLI